MVEEVEEGVPTPGVALLQRVLDSLGVCVREAAGDLEREGGEEGEVERREERVGRGVPDAL